MPADSDEMNVISPPPLRADRGVRILDHVRYEADLRSPDRNELFVDRAWWKVLSDTYDFEVCVRVALGPNDELLGAVPWVEIDDPGGQRLVSLPFCDVVDWPVTTQGWNVLGRSFADSDRAVAFTTPAEHVLSSDERFETEVDGVHHKIAVGDPDDMVGSFAELTRRMIRKSARAGMRYRLATDARALEQYYWLHVAVRKYRHGLLAQSPELFRAVSDNFFQAGNGGVLLAELDGEVVGGCILLVTPTAVHYKFAAANPDFYRHGVSHGTVLAALRYTAELGLDVFDFGRSDLVHTGLIDFKRRFRPDERPLATHRSRSAGSVERPGSRASAFRSQLRGLTDLYIDPAIPDDLSAAAGARLYRYFA